MESINFIEIKTIYLIKEFTPGDKIFTTLGNECIYKLFSEQHEFFTKPQIELNYGVGDARNTTIPNFYGYMLISIINKLNPIPGEITDINDEISRLSSVEELRLAVSNALNSIDGEDFSAVAALNSARKALEKGAQLDTSLSEA